ncbi:HisA/HisF-related TIM barrel protein [Bifidobacterium bombi]|uniref:1-(5-phosphoribosyl)-5-[(5-phosphoribosylamino)methylideneamino] imidazole-4-carboxamide isomerase n=1 Tax=Bifidobacterium bombi DSM 19703 TaxID=1341695 RepID=A0A086BNW7_9BIFI|nr:HisA/HisF-related TIM barrel protein [Bifidobacterium bombi]KFF30631.1 1-(5-phosphoribosyl)-5-[(5- phosphoribosylamino)methylideneamino] imidazole-4-carboxamide isomerase [Bifidobacterium bombi DSM 19703]
MLTLLPAVDVRGGKAVMRQGASGMDCASPVQIVRAYVDEGATWIHLVDLDAAFGTGDNRSLLSAIIRGLHGRVSIELSGGVHDEESLAAAIGAGVQRVNISTAALADMPWVVQALHRHGGSLAVCLDVRGRTLSARGGAYEGGDVFDALDKLDDAGCSRYIVTDVAHDGMMNGPNMALLRGVASHTTAHVTASGGIAGLEDLRTLKELSEGECPNLDAVIVGKALYAGAFTLAQALKAVR